MKANFWTTSNIIALTFGLMALPVGAAAGLFLLKKNQGPAPIVETTPEYILEREAEKNVRPPLETPEEDEVAPIAEAPEPEVIAEPEIIAEPEVVTEPEETPKEEVEPELIIADIEEEEIVRSPEPIAPEVKKWDTFRDSKEVSRLISRIDQATDQSEISEHRAEIRKAIESAEIVERIHNVTFNSANPHLDHRDETYLVSAMKNSAVMRKFGNHPNATLLVLGYASKDGDRRNNRYALNRAQSAEHSIHEHEDVLGIEAVTKSWCIGETDSLSKETDEHCSQHNRAAEIWLIVSNDEVFNEIESDRFLKTTIKESHHSDKHHH